MEDHLIESDADQLLQLHHELSTNLTMTTSLARTFDYLLITCCKIDEIDAGVIYLVDKITGGLRIASNYGLNSQVLKNIRSYDFASPETRLVMKGKPVYSQYPIVGNDIFSSKQMEKKDYCFISLIPVSYDGTVVASMNLYSRTMKSIASNRRLALEAFAMRGGAIIARVNAVLALQDSEQKYRSLLDTMNEGFLIIDENQRITYGNNRICEMLGYRIDEILGLPVTYFFNETNKSIFEKQMNNRGNTKELSYEISWTSAIGQNITTIVAPKAIVDKLGIFKGSFAVITDITAIKETSKMLENKERALIDKTKNLQEVNTALKVLLKKREEDKTELEEKVLANTQQLIYPIIEKIKSRSLNTNQQSLFEILESNLSNIISPFSKNLFLKHLELTPTELDIVNFIKEGKTNKEIASIMGLSIRTIETHRFRVRKKFKLNNNKISLRTYLLSFQ